MINNFAKKKILVTGGAGYIGSHCVLTLLKTGYDVVIFDNLSTGHIEIVNELKKYGNLDFIKGDLKNISDIENIFKTNSIGSVIHFAGIALVEESVKYPEKYYLNNVVGTINLLRVMLNNCVKKIVFSSTAATYGEPEYVPVDEQHPQNPVNPYGRTKLMIEKIMDDYDAAYGLKSVRLRYFNVVGADSDSVTGEWHEPETHLIPNLIKASFVDNHSVFKLYGNDYNTKDGTCIRDYIDIEDLVKAHILALEYLDKGGKTDYFNLGTNEGLSVQEVFNTCSKVLGQKIKYEIKPRRDGDPTVLVADNSKALKELGWKPEKKPEQSIKSAYLWEQKLRTLIK